MPLPSFTPKFLHRYVYLDNTPPPQIYMHVSGTVESPPMGIAILDLKHKKTNLTAIFFEVCCLFQSLLFGEQLPKVLSYTST